MSNGKLSISLNFVISDPYVNENGRLVIKITVAGESFEREVEYSEKEGGFVFVEIKE